LASGVLHTIGYHPPTNPAIQPCIGAASNVFLFYYPTLFSIKLIRHKQPFASATPPESLHSPLKPRKTKVSRQKIQRRKKWFHSKAINHSNQIFTK
jgi:hypothetical protein